MGSDGRLVEGALSALRAGLAVAAHAPLVADVVKRRPE
jgi:hypothetical protein